MNKPSLMECVKMMSWKAKIIIVCFGIMGAITFNLLTKIF